MEEAPNDRSRKYFARLARELRFGGEELRRHYESGAKRESLINEVTYLKNLLKYIGGAMGKGEIPVARPELHEKIHDLIYVFQETKYRGL